MMIGFLVVLILKTNFLLCFSFYASEDWISPFCYSTTMRGSLLTFSIVNYLYAICKDFIPLSRLLLKILCSISSRTVSRCTHIEIISSLVSSSYKLYQKTWCHQVQCFGEMHTVWRNYTVTADLLLSTSLNLGLEENIFIDVMERYQGSFYFI